MMKLLKRRNPALRPGSVGWNGRGKTRRRGRPVGADLFGREDVRGIGARILNGAIIEFAVSREESGKRLRLAVDDARRSIRTRIDLGSAERFGQPAGIG